jgi:hypothetical protein
MDLSALRWDFPGEGPNALTSAEDRARIWEAVRRWYDETRAPASAAVGPLFHDVDNVRALFDMLPAELPTWYRQKYGPWLKPSPLGVTVRAWAMLAVEVRAVVATVYGSPDYGWEARRRRRAGPAWHRTLGACGVERWLRASPSVETLWVRAKQADRCVAAMVGLLRKLPRDLCWAILARMELTGR